VLHAGHRGFCPLCPKLAESQESRVEGTSSSNSRPSTFDPRLLSGAVVLCVGPDVQADAGDVAVRIAVAGLLAAETIHPTGGPFGSMAANRRKGSAAGFFRRSLCGHAFCPDSRPPAV